MQPDQKSPALSSRERRRRPALDWAAPFIHPRICVTCGEALPDWRWPQCRRCYLLARLSTARTDAERQRIRKRLEQLDEHRAEQQRATE